METTATSTDRGHFLWHELMTTDKDAAIDFYTYVVGWSTQEFDWDGEVHEQPYTMWVSGEGPVGGVMPIDKEMMGDVPPNWMAYISTPDVDAAAKKAKELGGDVLVEPFDVPKIGRMAVLADPQGAAFAVYKPSEPTKPMWPPKLMMFSWNELATTDAGAARTFYKELLGWDETDEFDMGDGWIYYMYGRGDQTYGGIYSKPPDMAAPPHWLHYVRVDDIDAAVERVKEKGGQVLDGPMEVPGGDRVAQCMDPQGAAFALHEAKS